MNTEFKQVIILIEEARNRAFQKVNQELVLLYFKVGQFVSEKVSSNAWGDNTVGELAEFIQSNYSGYKSFTRRGLYRMKQFYEVYSSDQLISSLSNQLESYFLDLKDEKVSAVPTQLEDIKNQFLISLLCKITWTNHLEILSKTKSAEEKFFYLVHCIKERWSMRDLRRQLNTAYFERCILSNKMTSSMQKQIPAGLFKAPYIFDFLNIPDTHSEKDLEKALINNLQKFILEMGKGLTYMGNQYRLQVGNKDYYTDLLFYHRDLQCLVLFELKIQEFEPEFLGKLNFYLEALDRDIKRPFENPSIGVYYVKDSEVEEYAMARTKSPAIIADYETKLIPKQILSDKICQLVKQYSESIDDLDI